jgi:hypothetical protein
MKRSLLLLLAVVLFPQTASAWNATGHMAVAGVAWDNMTPQARQNAIALLQAAPADACLRDLFTDDARPLAERQREFFMRASTWSDLVRARDDNDDRPCTRFHRRNWHFINYFWSGISGGAEDDAPHDRTDIAVPEMNAVDRLTWFPAYVACDDASCGSTAEQRAIALAWILHLVGDIHQPLHTSAHVTCEADERQGDQGGNLFKIRQGEEERSLHSFWDGIINNAMRKQSGESDSAYADRVVSAIEREHPAATFTTKLRPGQFEAWAREGYDTTKRVAYPSTLQRNQQPSDAYRDVAFDTSRRAIALAGYRLADLLNRTLG